MMASSATNVGDIIKLHTEYSKPDPPPVEFLRHPDVFGKFIYGCWKYAECLVQTC